MTANKVLWSVNEELFAVETQLADPSTGVAFDQRTDPLMRLEVKLKRKFEDADFDGPFGMLSSIEVIQIKPSKDIIGRIWTVDGLKRGNVCESDEFKAIRIVRGDLKAGVVVASIDFHKANSLTF